MKNYEIALLGVKYQQQSNDVLTIQTSFWQDQICDSLWKQK